MTLPVVGQKVRITYAPHWDGIFVVIQVFSNKMITIDHPIHGVGGFFPNEYQALPFTKLERALK